MEWIIQILLAAYHPVTLTFKLARSITDKIDDLPEVIEFESEKEKETEIEEEEFSVGLLYFWAIQIIVVTITLAAMVMWEPSTLYLAVALFFLFAVVYWPNY